MCCKDRSARLWPGCSSGGQAVACDQGPGRSPSWERSGAGYDYNSLLGMSWLFYEAQRSGKLPRTNRIPWRGDSALGDTAPDGVSSVSGGWYDAGGAGLRLPGAEPVAG